MYEMKEPNTASTRRVGNSCPASLSAQKVKKKPAPDPSHTLFRVRKALGLSHLRTVVQGGNLRKHGSLCSIARAQSLWVDSNGEVLLRQPLHLPGGSNNSEGGQGKKSSCSSHYQADKLNHCHSAKPLRL